MALFAWNNLNCQNAAVVEIVRNGGILTYGWAVGPVGLAQHVWVVRDGVIVDPLGWSDHKPMGTRNMPDKAQIRELMRYCRDLGV